jgi:hypothetical protein
MSFGKDSLRKATAAALACFAFCGLARTQTYNLYEGQGVLENNWADWSWCTDNFASPNYIYEGTSSLEVTYTAGWQGFELVGPGFPAGYFTALRFTINGGPTAGRTITFSYEVNGAQATAINLNKFIEGGAVGKNSWRIVTVPFTAFGIKPTDTIGNFVLQEASGAAQPSFWIGSIGWVPNILRTPVKVAVDATKSLRTVDQKHFGVNTAVWESGFTSAACTDLLAQSEFKAYRFPGGSLSDGYHWATNTTDSNTWTWQFDFDQFAAIAVPATKGQCFITTNYGTGTPTEAANWVTYSNVTKKYGFKYWEIGNEVYGSWEEDSHARANDPVIYATQFAQYYKQMKAADPTIKVGAVSTPGEDAYANYSDEVVTNPVTHQKHSGWTAVMLSTMKGLGVTPDFIIYHRYPEYVNDCDFTLLIGNSGWLGDMADLRTQLNDYLGSAGAQTQIMCTENNCDAGTEGKQMCSIVNGVFMADTFGTVLQTECNSFLWWDWINGTSTTGDNGSWLYGWRMYGDEGVISPDFTQTYPCFWMEQVLNLFASAGDSVLPTTSSYGLLTAFTTKRSDGSIRIMVVNKHSTQELSTQFTFSGITPLGPATMYQYGIAQDNLAKNGKPQTIGVSTIKTWPTTATLSFPPYSVSVIVITKHK